MMQRMAIETIQPEPRAFDDGERRELSLSAEAIARAPGTVRAVLVFRDRAPGSRAARRYAIPLLRARVKLWHGEPADDEARLTAVAEDLLAPEPACRWVGGDLSPVPGSLSPVPQGEA